MSELTRVGPRYQVTIPLKVRKAIGLATGELIQADIGDRGTIILRRMQLVDYDAELARDLAESEADIKAGRVYGPFEAKDAIKGLRDAIAQARGKSNARGNLSKPVANSRGKRIRSRPK